MMNMTEKSSKFDGNNVFSAASFARKNATPLNIKQIRSFAKALMEVADHELLPDWTSLSVGERVSIAAHLIPEADRDAVMGVKAEYALKRWRDGTDISLNSVAAIAAETELPLAWIVSGRPIARRDAAMIQSQILSGPEDVPVQKLAFKVAAGHGEMMLDNNADHVRFPRGILLHAGVAPQNARLWEASGESMRDTISDGDLLLVDVSESAQQIVEGKIYVFSIGDDAFVKRLRKIGNQVLMISDNREMFPETAVPSDVPMRVYGRVKWAGRSL